MKKLNLPHRVVKSTCFSNGLEDILEWKGRKYIDYLLPILGGMGEFTYLKFKSINPPHQVYWGANTKYLIRDLGSIIGFKEIISENKSFKNTLIKIKESIEQQQPVVAGALDMYYLPYYPEIYYCRHIPIHYILIVGYDDEQQEVYIQDCGRERVERVSYGDLEKALSVNVPGMSKKNTIRTFELPEDLPSELEIAKKGLKFRAEKMLNPLVKLFGIPAMRKLVQEIFNWDDKGSFEHLIIYATTPPQLNGTLERSDGMRFWKSQVLKELGGKYNRKEWQEVADIFYESGKLIIEICRAAKQQNKEKIAETLARVANREEEAYQILRAV